MSGARLVVTTTGSREEAERIASALVEERLAACVNIIGGIRSVYRWKDAVESADEVLMLVKTQQAQVERLRTRIHELHSYEVPEFLVLEIAGGSAAYLEWIAAGVR